MPGIHPLLKLPTVVDLAGHLAADRHQGADLETPALDRLARQDRLARKAVPLSFAQQRQWFLDRLASGSALYHLPVVLHLTGGLDRQALRRALNELVRRHQVLRTNVKTVDGEPVQVIRPASDPALPVLDLSGLPDCARRSEARRRILAEARRPFDLARAPLFRARLVRRSRERHTLLVTVHHIVFDGWSLEVFLHELAVLYPAFSAGPSIPGMASPLPELPVQYADFAAAQRRRLSGDTLGEARKSPLAYWREQLCRLPVLDLPTDRPRPAVQSFQGTAQPFSLEAELGRRLEELSREQGTTLYVTLLAAFQVLLGRSTRQQDLAVAAAVADRDHRELRTMVGPLVNTLVLRGDLSGAASGPTFRQLLGRLHDVVRGACAHRELPFELLVEKLAPERNLSQNPLAQVLFVFHSHPPAFARELAPGLGVELGSVATGAVLYDLTLVLAADDGRWTGALAYNTDLFDATTIRRMADRLGTLLAGLAADPERRLMDLPWLSRVEEHQVVAEWNDTRAPTSERCCLHELFEAQAAKTPEAVAVVGCGQPDRRLSYRELNRRANRLAHHLRSLGAGPEVLVGICMDRSPEMVVGILGVLKSGGAYLPLDPDYPRERLGFMLEDARARVLLTKRSLLATLPDHRARIVCTDADEAAIAEHSASNPRFPCAAANLAYLIYTSGSTGRAKGVAIEHRSAVAMVEWARGEFSPAEVAGVLASTSICFDLSIFELFSPLSLGGKVIVADDALALPALAAAAEVTLVNTVPSALREVLRFAPLPAAVRTVNLAGEPFHQQLVDRTYAEAAVERMLNLYGPSEDTTYSTFARLAPGGASPVPIGRPLTNTRVYLLDRQGRSVPPGNPGELFLSGDGLARGYFDRPELTAAAFVPDPFRGGGPGRRRYRTGDLARYRPDGNLEFLGRRDHQVKLRGFRIELGEIEAALVHHPGLREAVVVARTPDRCRKQAAAPAGAEDRQLVAYLVHEPGTAADPRALRRFLAQTLPDYMVPGAFVVLEALPLTPTGKVDRRALPAPARSAGAREGEFVAPRDPSEELVAGIWAQVLGLDRVGVHDHFFEIGGHSLLATQVLSRLPQAFGVELPVHTLFEVPTVAELASRIQAARQGEQGVAPPPIRPLARTEQSARDGLPLSFAQQRLWFLDRIAPHSAVYNIPLAFRLRGPLRPAALEGGVDEIVRRHEVLRTRLVEVAGEPRQVVCAPQPLGLPVVDLAALAPAERETEVLRLATAEARRPFRLEQGPLVRCALLRLDAATPEREEHVFLVTFHHVAADGWSLGVFHRELEALYEKDPGPAAPLPELPIQYADFACWQRRWLQGEVWDRQLDYWKRCLAGRREVLELATDRPRPPVGSDRGAKRSVVLAQEWSASLRALSRAQAATLFMTLVAAFQALLARITGQDDLTVGSVIANRNRPEIEALVGFFVNTLLLRAPLRGDPSFRELLDRMREVTLGAYAHQDLPFEHLVEALQPQRDRSRQPLFQVMFALQNTPGPGLRLPRLKVTPFEVDNGTAKFDLTLSLDDGAAGLSGWIEYRTELFDRTTILRLWGSFHTLLAGIVADPERRLSQLPLLSTAAEHQLLVEWNDTATPFRREATIHQLFEAQVAKTPEAVAVVFAGSGPPGEQVSYRELNRRANRLAHSLRARGVGPEVCVGLCVERSVEMVVGILGILKAGGAFVPLDPSYPPERLSFMLEDAGPKGGRPRVLVAQDRQLAHLAIPSAAQLRRIDLDRGGATLCRYSSVNPSRTAAAENLAYVMYTSGSTGRPKGVGVAHRGVVRLVTETNYAELDAQGVFLQLAPISFDASTLEIWGPLVNGGRLVVFPPHPPSLRELGAALDRYRVTTLWLTAGLFHPMVDENPSGLRAVRQLLAGGDVLSARHVRRVLEELPGCTLINGYGPTESTTFTCCSPMRVPSEVGEPVSIGRPIANTRVHVLDPQLRPVPLGVPGELFIGGDGLAREYLNQPGLTAERFVPSPRGERAGDRLYRSGDVVRYLPDGRIEFLGRRDFQVKVRGFRIELGEVAAAVSRHPAVRAAVVMAASRDSAGTGERRLIAYVVAEKAGTLDAGELRGFLGESLPGYMVPAAVVFLDALPLSPSGKVDRRALPAPEPVAGELAETSAVTRGPLEEIVAGFFAEILGVAGVGIHDDFFQLGGHSLMATRVASRASAALGVEIGPQQLFERPTVAALATEIERLSSAGRPAPIEALGTAAKRGPLPLSFAQERLWFLQQLQPEGTAYNSAFPMHFTGSLDREALRRAFEEIVRRHEVLRTTFAIVDEQPMQRISRPRKHPLPLADLGALTERDRQTQVEQLMRGHEGRPFDLSRDPLLRTTLLRLSGVPDPDEHVLLVCCHHIAFDGWSMAIVAHELAALYRAFAAGPQARTGPPPLAPLPIQYADFASWQRRWLSGDELDRQLAWWRARLESPRPPARLAPDHPRSEAGGSRAVRRRFRVAATTSQGLRILSRRQGATLFMTLAAAFQTLVHRHTGADSVVVGTPIANRNRREIEGLIGFFVNTQVLRTDFHGDPIFREVLERVREATLGAYAHQDLPFERLVEALQPDRRAGSQPLFQVLFTLQNAPLPPFELPGVTIRTLEVKTGKRDATFDLTLGMMEIEQTLDGILDYDAAVFEPATIEALVDHFLRLLEEIAADPDRAVGDLQLMSESERRRLLDEGSRIDPTSRVWREIRDRVTAAEAAATVYVLDRERRLVPTCAVGEIHLGAITPQADGKSAAPELAPEPGRSLLATGLRGRWRANGRLDLVADSTTPEPASGERREEAPDDPVATAMTAAQQLRSKVSKRRDHLSDAKRALLARRLRGRSQKTSPAAGISRRPAHEPAPLSFAQERLWFLDQLMPGKPAYNVPLPLRLRGRLDRAALGASFAEILRRHEVLRATFPTVDGKPIMTFSPPQGGSLPLVDLGALPVPAREQQAGSLVRIEAWRPFDLARGPLVRIFLLRLGTEDHLLMFTTHHIVFDGWSGGILNRELAALYPAFRAGTACELEELPIQYADFAHWQRQGLHEEVLERQLDYWKQQLAGAPLVLDLPTDRPRPAVQSFRGKWPPVALPRDLSESLAALSRRQDATLYMTLLAAFNALLARTTGQEDILVGSPIADRNHREVEGLIGLFLNTLVLRTDLSGRPSFRDLLARVRQRALDAFAHQDLPFERLVVALAADRDLSITPLVQVMFALQNTPRESLDLPAIRLSPEAGQEAGTVKYDLGLALEERAAGLVGDLEYSSDLFDDATIQRFFAHFERLLRGIVEDPDKRLGQLPWWTESERHHLLAEWNDTATADLPAPLLHTRFEGQVERRPDAVAVVYDAPAPGSSGRQWTYRELNRRADRLAHRLRALGVGRSAGTEGLVGICVERSPEMVLAILGVLKAGGGWLPLDPEYPRQRLAFMMADTGLSVILTQERLLGVLPEHAAQVVCLDRDGHAAATGSAAPRVSGVRAENVAYVIYTSGSTGRPKGVVLTHGGLANLAAAQVELIGLRPADRVLQFFSLNFDASVWEIAMTLAAGAALHLAPRESLLPGAALGEILRARQITTASLAPPVLAALAADDLPGIETLVTGGEACPAELARRWSAGRRFYNLYGPTETTVCATIARLGEGGLVSIGTPIANTRTYLVDRDLEPVPPGVPGELVIGGAGVARGYLNRPALTAERFVPDPFAGGRLYRSGDLARYRADGHLEFLGRIDDQVKIRGFRIELGEIEVALRRHPAVRESAVVVREDHSGDRRLVACLVPEGEPAPAAGELRDFLQETLPEYLVPAAFVWLDALPATPHGKVDRTALSGLALPAPAPVGPSVAPRDALELQLTRIWQELLEVQPVGIRSNFFALGGHSLLAVRLMAQIRRDFGHELPLALLFQEGTVEHLAATLRRQPGGMRRRALVAIRPEGSQPPFFCVHPGGGNVLCYGDLARHLAPDQPFYGLQVPDREGKLFLTTVEGMAEHYVEAVREVQPQGPYRLGGWSMGGLVALEMARRLAAQSQRVERLVLIDTLAPTADQGQAAEPDDASLALWFARDLAGIQGARLPMSAADLEAFTTAEEVLASLYEKMRAADCVPPGLELSEVGLLFEMYRNNIRAAERYRVASYPGRLVLIQARERLAEGPEVPDGGWGELAEGGVEVHGIPGHHYSILREPDVQNLADRLREVLARA